MAKKGISKIKIPIRLNDLTIELVEKYLPTIFSQFQSNAEIIRSDYDKYCLDHDILSKVRPHDDTDVNNIVLIPNLKSVIDWKLGYVFGNPIKYTQTKTENTNDIEYLNKYVRNAKQRSVDKEVGKWAYATGVGYYFVEPKSNDFNIETEAPYELYCREADTCTKVYSSFGGNKPLCDILYTTYEEINENNSKTTVKVLDIYFPTFLYTYELRLGSWVRVNAQTRNIAKPLPLVEKRYNSDGIGIVAMGESMQNALDSLISNGLDNVQDIVNEIFVYHNTNLGDTPQEQKDNHNTMKKNGAIILKDPNKDISAKLETISPKMSLGEIREMFGVINSIFHSVIGVPMEMSDTNSGGTTKQGSEVANGYENAYNRALDDINTFIEADTELLEKIMWVCQNTPNNKVDMLAPSEIEIKYSLNLTDNILTKTQSFINLIGVGVPPAMALRLCKLSNDAEAEGRVIEEYKAKQQNEQQKKETVNENITVTKKNNSQE